MESGESNLRDRKRRASRACSSCNARKVRCDVTTRGQPCTGCRIDHYKCEVPARKTRRKRSDKAEDPLRRCSPASSNEPSSTLLPPPKSTRQSLSQHEIIHQVPHYPFLLKFAHVSTHSQPSIRSSKSFEASQSSNGSTSQTPGLPNVDPPENLAFLRQRGALDLPDSNVVDKMIHYYFHFIHPFFPIIDKSTFLSTNNLMKYDKREPSLLLLQAVLFSASSLVPVDLLRDAGYTTRRQARKILYKRTKDLYLLDYESDNVVMVQALLLMSYYYPSMIEQKHTWHWVHQAISLAQATGMHRDPGNVAQRRLWARIWWACLVRDRLVSLGTGRPMHVNSVDCNVPMPILKDLQEPGDNEDESAVKTMFIEFVKLCQYMEGVLSLRYATTTTTAATLEQIRACGDGLQSWLQSLPPVARRQGESVSFGDNPSITTLYRAILHQLYNVTIISLYQPYHIISADVSASYHRGKHEINLAALDTTDIATQLVSHDLVKYCPTYCVTCILPPLIVHLLEIRNTPSRDTKALHTNQYNLCMTYLRELGKIYWHASFYCDFFDLAASIDSDLPTQSRTETQDPLISFLQQQMGFNQKIIPKFVNTVAKKAQDGDDELEQHADNNTRSRIQYLSTSESRTIGSSMSLPIMPGVQERSESQHMNAGMLNNMADSNRLFGNETSADIFADPRDDDLQFEEWLGTYGTFQHIFPSA